MSESNSKQKQISVLSKAYWIKVGILCNNMHNLYCYIFISCINYQMRVLLMFLHNTFLNILKF